MGDPQPSVLRGRGQTQAAAAAEREGGGGASRSPLFLVSPSQDILLNSQMSQDSASLPFESIQGEYSLPSPAQVPPLRPLLAGTSSAFHHSPPMVPFLPTTTSSSVPPPTSQAPLPPPPHPPPPPHARPSSGQAGATVELRANRQGHVARVPGMF